MAFDFEGLAFDPIRKGDRRFIWYTSTVDDVATMSALGYFSSIRHHVDNAFTFCRAQGTDGTAWFLLFRQQDVVQAIDIGAGAGGTAFNTTIPEYSATGVYVADAPVRVGTQLYTRITSGGPDGAFNAANWTAIGSTGGSGTVTRVATSATGTLRAPTAGEVLFHSIDASGGSINITLPAISTVTHPYFITTSGVLFDGDGAGTNRVIDLFPAAGDSIRWSDVFGQNSQDVNSGNQQSITINSNHQILLVDPIAATVQTLTADWGSAGAGGATTTGTPVTYDLTVTAQNSIANLSPTPTSAVDFYIDGLLKRTGITNAGAVVTVDANALGFNVQTHMQVAARYVG